MSELLDKDSRDSLLRHNPDLFAVEIDGCKKITIKKGAITNLKDAIMVGISEAEATSRYSHPLHYNFKLDIVRKILKLWTNRPKWWEFWRRSSTHE